MSRYLFWVAFATVVAYGAAACYLAYNGISATPALLMGFYMLGCSWLLANSQPRPPGLR